MLSIIFASVDNWAHHSWKIDYTDTVWCIVLLVFFKMPLLNHDINFHERFNFYQIPKTIGAESPIKKYNFIGKDSLWKPLFNIKRGISALIWRYHISLTTECDMPTHLACSVLGCTIQFQWAYYITSIRLWCNVIHFFGVKEMVLWRRRCVCVYIVRMWSYKFSMIFMLVNFLVWCYVYKYIETTTS